MSLNTRKFIAIVVLGLGFIAPSPTVLRAGDHKLNVKAQAELDELESQLRSNSRRNNEVRGSAREIAQQIETLRSQIINLAKHETMSEKRASIYRARLQTLNIMEQDLTQKLGALRAKEGRLLSALQIYSRNPPPLLFISSRKTNDAVRAAILMRAITPALKQRAASLAQQNKTLIGLRRQAAIQSEALFVTQSDVSDQRAKIAALISERVHLEDQLLAQADKLDAQHIALRARAARIRGDKPFLDLTRGHNKGLNLILPAIGEKMGTFTNKDEAGPYSRGISLATAPAAQIISPAEGEIEYAGALGSYGQVIIISIGGNYRIVLAGLGRVYVERGATVAKGEPLGRMPNVSKDKTRLYLELRNAETPVNPAPQFNL